MFTPLLKLKKLSKINQFYTSCAYVKKKHKKVHCGNSCCPFTSIVKVLNIKSYAFKLIKLNSSQFFLNFYYTSPSFTSMARPKRGHRDHLIDDHETDTDDDDSPPSKPTAIPKDWKSRCFKDLHWCKHFLLGLYVNNMLDKIPGISFVPPTMSPSQKAAIKEECKGNEKCIWKKTKKWDDKNVLPELVKAALAGGGGGDSSDDSHTTDGRSGRQSNMGLIIAVAVASGIISLLLLLILIYCCCCTGKAVTVFFCLTFN